jgi:hypothetical protein
MKKRRGMFKYSFNDPWSFRPRDRGVSKLRKTPVFIRTFIEPMGPARSVAGQVRSARRGI